MKKIFLFVVALFVLLLAVTVYATDKLIPAPTTHTQKQQVNGDEDVEVESQDDGSDEDIVHAPEAQNPDAVENGEDVEEYKGNIEDLKNSDKTTSLPEGGESSPASEDPHADEKYQQALQSCEQKAEDSGDFEASLRKCMDEQGFAQDLNDAENNVF